MKKILSQLASLFTRFMEIGGLFLVALMFLIVANIIYRAFGHIIAGTYELSQLLAVAAVSFALIYATLGKSHVIINILISRFPSRSKSILELAMSVITFIVWVLVTWGSATILSEKWLNENTEMLDIPFLPFRFIWVICLSIVCFAYLINIATIFRREFRK